MEHKDTKTRRVRQKSSKILRFGSICNATA